VYAQEYAYCFNTGPHALRIAQAAAARWTWIRVGFREVATGSTADRRNPTDTIKEGIQIWPK
jgi:hypothetical protein